MAQTMYTHVSKCKNDKRKKKMKKTKKTFHKQQPKPLARG
jgi:hypothetical protein